MTHHSAATARILIVDDDAYVCASLQAVLESEGYQVTAVQRGAEGLLLLGKVQPDLVILDLLMPDMDGLETLRRIRQISPVPVLMLTARPEEADRLRSLVAGVDGYLLKPIDLDTLLAAVRNALKRPTDR